MSFKEKLGNILLDETERVGSFAIQTDHPGLLPSLKKRKTTKADRSIFAYDDDAKKQYITGTMDASGRPKGKKNKSKIYERISERLGEIDGH